MPTVPLVRRKTIGKHVIWERKPKPKGLSKYVVGLDGDGQNMVRDFSRYALAVLWIKAQSPRPVPKVVVVMKGGQVRAVLSTVALDYTVVDATEEHCICGESHAIVDPDRIASILNTIPIKLS